MDYFNCCPTMCHISDLGINVFIHFFLDYLRFKVILNSVTSELPRTAIWPFHIMRKEVTGEMLTKYHVKIRNAVNLPKTSRNSMKLSQFFNEKSTKLHEIFLHKKITYDECWWFITLKFHHWNRIPTFLKWNSKILIKNKYFPKISFSIFNQKFEKWRNQFSCWSQKKQIDSQFTWRQCNSDWLLWNHFEMFSCTSTTMFQFEQKRIQCKFQVNYVSSTYKSISQILVLRSKIHLMFYFDIQ